MSYPIQRVIGRVASRHDQDVVAVSFAQTLTHSLTGRDVGQTPLFGSNKPKVGWLVGQSVSVAVGFV